MTNPWQKKHQETKEQLLYEMPPTWQGTGKNNDKRSQKEKVYQSCPQRLMVGALIERINEAKQMIVLCSFLVADLELQEAILEAAKRGVRVYLMLASEARLKHEPEENREFDKRVFNEHKEMIDQLAGYVMLCSAGEFHAKVVLIDPETPQQWGLLLTANLTREALSRNEELGVPLSPNEVRETFEKLRWALWERAEHQSLKPGQLSPVKPLGKLQQPDDVEHILWTSEGRAQIKDRALALIRGESQKIIVSSFGWEKEHELVEALCERARAGVTVQVLARVRPAAMKALIALSRAGAQVVGFKWLHAKGVWTPQSGALVTSANFETHGMDKGFELAVFLQGERHRQLGEILDAWFENAPWKLFAEPLLGELEGKVQIWHQQKLVKKSVSPQEEIDLGEQQADGVEALELLKRPPLPPKSGLPTLAHEVMYTWTTTAPVLNNKAKELRRTIRKGKKKSQVPYEPPVFDEPGGRRVVAIESYEELPAAKKLMAETKAVAIVRRRD